MLEDPFALKTSNNKIINKNKIIEVQRKSTNKSVFVTPSMVVEVMYSSHFICPL